jgi:hypothetical protein
MRIQEVGQQLTTPAGRAGLPSRPRPHLTLAPAEVVHDYLGD